MLQMEHSKPGRIDYKTGRPGDPAKNRESPRACNSSQTLRVQLLGGRIKTKGGLMVKFNSRQI